MMYLEYYETCLQATKMQWSQTPAFIQSGGVPPLHWRALVNFFLHLARSFNFVLVFSDKKNQAADLSSHFITHLFHIEA